jgi:hypothetical protein
MDLLTVLWLFPIVFMFHDFEEILTVEKWTRANRQKVAALFPKWFPKWLESSFHMTTLQFSRDVFWIFLFITLAALLAVQFSFYPFFILFLTVFFLHVFTHVGIALYLRSYTPGVFTAVVLVLPYSLLAYDRLFHEQILNWSNLFLSMAMVILLFPFFALMLIKERNRLIGKKQNDEKRGVSRST